MDGGDELSENSNPLLALVFDDTRIYVLEAELKKDASKTIKE